MKFMGYRRSDGRVGIRNHVLILPACACGSESSRIVASQVRLCLTRAAPMLLQTRQCRRKF